MNKILIIDDDVDLCELLTEYLSSEGFLIESVHEGNIGIEKVLNESYDLIILDVMLPEINGFEILGKIRSSSKIPVLMLTAKGDDVDRIVGLEMGADDYLSKPFNPRELVARIRAVLRRTHGDENRVRENKLKNENLIKVGDIEIDTGALTVLKSEKPVVLTSVEFNLLTILLRKAGEVVLREYLIQKVLGRDLTPFDRSIDVHISNLRKKLGHKCGNTERIKTIRGIGYLYSKVDIK